jgi:23S rRNA pseudouridine2605 synthase
MAEERIQKILAAAGYGSRRACEAFLEAGRVRVNGEVAKLGDKADAAHDQIELDGKPIKALEAFEYYMVNKPRYVISSTEAQGDHKTVFDLVNSRTRLFVVGRLDLESEGLMLLTNDGELANRLTHPRYGHEKEYRVLVANRPDDKQLDAWRRGVVLEDGYKTGAVDVRVEKNQGKGTWLRVIMGEGHKRQIRETARVIGLPVVKLIRVRIGSLELARLPVGKSRPLNDDEIKGLKGRPVKRAVRKGSAPGRSMRGARAARRAGEDFEPNTDRFSKPASKPKPRTGGRPRKSSNPHKPGTSKSSNATRKSGGKPKNTKRSN